MMRVWKLFSLLLPGLVLFAGQAFAQRWEVQPFVGYKYGGNVPTVPSSAGLNISNVSFDASVAYGVTGGINVTDHFGLEFLWNRQPTTAVGQLVTGGAFPQTVSATINQYHGNFLINLRDPDAKLRPFLLFGFGASNISGASSSTTRFSYGLGGGVKYFFTQNMGLRVQARYAPTYLYSTAGGVWCNWWGFCWLTSDDHYLNQGDVTVGWIFRF